MYPKSNQFDLLCEIKPLKGGGKKGEGGKGAADIPLPSRYAAQSIASAGSNTKQAKHLKYIYIHYAYV